MENETKTIRFIEREMTSAELDQMKAGFVSHSMEHGNPPKPSERHTFVMMDGGDFIGCASGLTTDSLNWFYLTDLFIEKAYRRQGLGAAMLRKLEERVVLLGIQNIWTQTAGYEAPVFYQKQGYEILFELEAWYPSGHSLIGLRKRLGQR